MSESPADESTPPRGEHSSLAAPIALLVLLGAMTVFLAIDHLVITQKERGWVSHSRDVIETTQALFSSAIEVESAQRAYGYKGDARYLDHFDSDQAAVVTDADALRDLVSDNPAQKARVNQLVADLGQRVAVSVQRVEAYRQGRLAEAINAQPQAGKTAMDRARADVRAIMRSESALLAQRTASSNRDELVGFIIALLVSSLSIAGLAALMVLMAAANRRLAREIQERRSAEAARRASEARYRAIYANSADLLSVIELTPDGAMRVEDVNPAYEAATGMAADQVRGVELKFLVPEPQASAITARLKSIAAGGRAIMNRDVVRLPAGERVWESMQVPLRDVGGHVDRILVSSRDVTERENAQERLRQAQRMEAVGHLTGGVAHDFNNLLQVIRGNLELISRKIVDGETLQRLKNAIRSADRAAELTRQLLAFARRQPLEPKVVNLGRLITDMAEMLRRTLGEAVDVETIVAGGLWNTLADPAQVESAVLNLALNARDAMPDGGRLTIEITNASLDEAYTRTEREEVEPGQYVLLAVSDTGQGMEADVVARVFEPFFSTKVEGKGTGLGLSMVYGFVKQSDGHVKIYSEPGQGTTVKIYLPRSRQVATVEPVIEGSLAGRSEVILVVEDDELVRASAVGMLRDLGYACLHAHDGAAALELLKRGAKIDLLFTDVVMPGPVKSRDLATEAETLRPGLPVLFTSGYTENAIVHHGRLDPGVQLLSKPYSREDLARKIRGLLKAAHPVVLVVEDDPLVRMAAADMVESLGFTALQAATADEALKLLKADGRIDILFTDIGLPGMRGPALAQEALTGRPDLKIVFASGYGETDEASAVEGAAHLGKPYQHAQLAEALGKTAE